MKIASQQIKHYVIGGSGPFPGASLFRGYARLKAIIREEQPDIVQSHLPGTNIIACFACRDTGIPHILMEEGLGVTRPLWERILRKKAFRMPQRFVCNSEAIRERMITREKIDPSRITLIRNAVTISGTPSREESRIKLNIPEDCFVVFTAASLKPVKGIDHLIRGFLKFSRSCTAPSMLLIAGDGKHRSEYEHLAREAGEGRVRFLGIRNDISDLMAASDVYVSSSLSEGLSNSIIEAMHSRLPVIATEVGGSAVLFKDRKFGRLIAPGSSEEIFRAISEFSEQGPSLEELNEAKKYANEEFSTNRVVKQFTGLYRELLNGKK